MVKNGLTTVEVLISLTIMSIFIFAGFQLYGTVLAGNLESQSRSKAANIAYSHLRKITNSINLAECKEEIIVKDIEPKADENLPNIKIQAKLSAPHTCINRLMRVEVTVDYAIRGSARREVQAVYVQK